MTPFLKQCLVAVGVSMNNLAYSGAMAYTAILLPRLRESTMRLSAEQESWLASLLAFAMFLGNLMTVPAMRRGRRLAHQLVSLLHVASWVTTALARSYEVLMVGRFIQGTSLGLFMPINGVILGEYTSPKYRGGFLATISLGQGVGVCFVHIVGSFISWQYTALILSFFPLTSFVITIFLPESPSWLAVEERYDECRKTFRWLRGCCEEEELNKMIQSRQHGNQTKTGSFRETLRAFSKREVYISLTLGALMYVIAMYCGALTLASYMNDILTVVISPDCNCCNLWYIAVSVCIPVPAV